MQLREGHGRPPYREQAKALLRLATATHNLRDRGRLLDEAAWWHDRALDDVDYSTEPRSWKTGADGDDG